MVRNRPTPAGPSSTATRSHVRQPRGQWFLRAVFAPPSGPSQQQIAAERTRLHHKIEALTTQIRDIDKLLSQMCRSNRRYVLDNRHLPRGGRDAPGFIVRQARLGAKRSRAIRSLTLVRRRVINGVPRGFSRHHGFPSVEVFTLGQPESLCQYCSAVMWKEESTLHTRSRANPVFSLCCKGGKVKLPPRCAPPQYLKELLESTTPLSRHFREAIRIYNAVFCFISLGGKVDQGINDGGGVYVYAIGGQIYHSIGSLLPAEGQAPKFAQLYIHDSSTELQNRLQLFPSDDTANSLRPTIVEGLQEMFDGCNVLVQTFRMARQKISEEPVQEVKIKLFAKRAQDGREYDLPTGNDIAALIVDETGHDTFEPDIIVQYKSSQLERINYHHPSLMALQYPILFPYGEDGWHPDIICDDDENNLWQDNTLTQCDYYAYRLQTRFNQSNSVLLAGKLFQQYVVNAYALVEAERLDWIRHNQSKLRRHYVSGLLDAFLRGDSDLDLIGKHVILAASHTGSPRYKYENFQDAMAICRWLGYPDLFITFTCNANWPEIQFMVDLVNSEGRKDVNRSDIFARVFKLKLHQLMTEIRDKKIFGQTTGHVMAIEFQKRGLPHAHILVFLASEYKLSGPKEIDSVISAEIPNRDIDPEGYRAVTTYMLHGPCGSLGRNAPCTEGGICTKHFPKQFCEQTTIDDTGFAKYCRRDSGIYAEVHGVPLDNRFVVTYNRYLLLRFDAHINVEFCNKSSYVTAIKYLFKYINKPQDRAKASLVGDQTDIDSGSAGPSSRLMNRIDEIKAYLDCRYITSGEACWRLFKFDVYSQYPSVLRMSYHLPGQNVVVSRATTNPQHVLNSKRAQTSMLLGWMKMNELSIEARQYTFVEFPQHYVWDDTKREWHKRKSKFSIGRLYYCHPSPTNDRFYLRMLLHIVRGCCNFEDIRTVDGVVHKSFKEACYAHGLLAEDNEWNDCLAEASVWATGKKLRSLFVTIINLCQVSDIGKLWERNWALLADDILYTRRKELNMPTLQMSESQLKEYCLIEIDKLLSRNCKSISDFPGLPILNADNLSSSSNRLLAAELNYNTTSLSHQLEAIVSKLNVQQKIAYEEILDSVYGDKGKSFFIDGCGGTGKTFLWKVICMKLRSEMKIVLCVASSGIAALLMDGGRTAHSRFQIPVDIDGRSTCNIAQESELAELIQRASLIIWDEVVMSHKHVVEAVDRSLRDILRIRYENSQGKPFGGLTIVFGGDFRQTLPIVLKGTRTDIVNSSIKRSYLWQHLRVIKLVENMRLAKYNCSPEEAAQISEFHNWLLQVGDGPDSDVFGESTISIPPSLLVNHATDPIIDIVSSIYGDLKSSQVDHDYLVSRAILAPHHDMVSAINGYVLSEFPGDEVTYFSSDSIEIDPGKEGVVYSDYSVEFLNTLKIGNFPEHELKLKVGCPVILLRNMDQTVGLCNGTRMVVKTLGKWFIEVEILTGTNIGDRVFLPRLALSTYYKSLNFTLMRRQYPIALCFAMTINKSQGQTLDHVGLCLQKQVFSHGQLYVALSRVTTKQGLKIFIGDDNEEANKSMLNIVFPEIFS